MDILHRLIPFSFNFGNDFIEKFKNVQPYIETCLSSHSTPKDRSKGLKEVGQIYEIFPSNRSNEEYLLLEAVAILYLLETKEGRSSIVDLTEFLTQFPEFSDQSQEDKKLLLNFRNLMAVAVQIIPAKWNYNHLLDLVARISEGANVRYVTGSGATDQTKYRVSIYERIGGVTKQKRPPRHFDMLIDILRQRSDPLESKPLEPLDSNSSDVMGDSIGRIELPVRLSSRPLCPIKHPDVIVNTNETVDNSGLLIRNSSLTRTSLDEFTDKPSQVELIRSASITSVGLGELDMFDFLHEEEGFQFLETPELNKFSLTHQSLYSDCGAYSHDISVTENLNSQSSNYIENIKAPPPPLVSEKIGKINKKRKIISDEKGPPKKEKNKQNDRYQLLTSKLSKFIFNKEGLSKDIEAAPIRNVDFINKVLGPQLEDLEKIIITKSNPKEVRKRLKTFSTELGIDPVSRFNDKYLITEAALILLLSSREEYQYLKKNMAEFLAEFPEFADIDADELNTLHAYRNMMAAALEVIPAVWSSNHLLDIVTRIVEGKEVKYITGSGATKQTKNRLKIYEKLGNITKKTKPSKFFNSVFDFLNEATPVSQGNLAMSTEAKANEVLEIFKESFEKPSLTLEIKSEKFNLPEQPDVIYSSTEILGDSLSCKATRVTQEMRDAVSGNAFTLELARGVSMCSTGGYDLFENFDISGGDDDSNSNNDGLYRNNSLDLDFISMLQENGQTGIQLHRATSASFQGLTKTLSLSRQVSGEINLLDKFNRIVDQASINKEV